MLVEVLELDVPLWVVELGAELVEVALELLEVPTAPDGAEELVLVLEAPAPAPVPELPELEPEPAPADPADDDFEDEDEGPFLDSGIGSGIGSGPVAVVVGHRPVSLRIGVRLSSSAEPATPWEIWFSEAQLACRNSGR
jgi:hypothetical protein